MTKETVRTNQSLENLQPQAKRQLNPLQKINERGNLLIIFCLILVLGIGYLIYLKTKTSQSPTIDKIKMASISPLLSDAKEESYKNYSSKNLKFTIKVPNNFILDEKFTSVFLKNDHGEITISRIGTNFKDTESYLDDLAIKNHLQFVERQNIKIEDNEFMKVKIKDPNNTDKISTIYYYYIDYTVYSLSTSSETLYPTLDQIAQSFRYTP